ncbi:hypothetical protein C8T65DRAFT_264330 [Cerioporus squamosus]|nr:hypothetical protein C8T65DRAFT_264330 [Cerioporus squamosus]
MHASIAHGFARIRRRRKSRLHRDFMAARTRDRSPGRYTSPTGSGSPPTTSTVGKATYDPLYASSIRVFKIHLVGRPRRPVRTQLAIRASLAGPRHLKKVQVLGQHTSRVCGRKTATELDRGRARVGRAAGRRPNRRISTTRRVPGAQRAGITDSDACRVWVRGPSRAGCVGRAIRAPSDSAGTPSEPLERFSQPCRACSLARSTAGTSLFAARTPWTLESRTGWRDSANAPTRGLSPRIARYADVQRSNERNNEHARTADDRHRAGAGHTDPGRTAGRRCALDLWDAA